MAVISTVSHCRIHVPNNSPIFDSSFYVTHRREKSHFKSYPLSVESSDKLNDCYILKQFWQNLTMLCRLVCITVWLYSLYIEIYSSVWIRSCECTQKRINTYWSYSLYKQEWINKFITWQLLATFWSEFFLFNLWCMCWVKCIDKEGNYTEK